MSHTKLTKNFYLQASVSSTMLSSCYSVTGTASDNWLIYTIEKGLMPAFLKKNKYILFCNQNKSFQFGETTTLVEKCEKLLKYKS